MAVVAIFSFRFIPIFSCEKHKAVVSSAGQSMEITISMLVFEAQSKLFCLA